MSKLTIFKHRKRELCINLCFLCNRSYLAEVLDPKSDIPKPDDLKGGKERMVFGNIEAIYEWHKK